MSRKNGYQNKIREYASYFATQQTIPQNTTTVGDEGAIYCAPDQGMMEIVVAAATACVLAASKKMIVEIYTSATETGSYVKVNTIEKHFPAAQQDFAIGDIIMVAPVPSDLENLWVKVYFGNDDAAATGTCDVFKHYLGR